MVFNRAPTQTAQNVQGDERRILETKLSSDPMSALSKRPETWAGLADELAAKGEFREAIRHLYLALLSRLHRDGVIDYDPTKSNWDYLLAFKGCRRRCRPSASSPAASISPGTATSTSTGFAYQTFRSHRKALLAPLTDSPGGPMGRDRFPLVLLGWPALGAGRWWCFSPRAWRAAPSPTRCRRTARNLTAHAGCISF